VTVVGGNHQLAFLAGECPHRRGIGIDQRLEQFGKDGLRRPLLARDCQQWIRSAKSERRQQPRHDQHKIVSAWQIQKRAQRLDRASSFRGGDRQHACRPAKAHRWGFNDPPSIGSDFDGAPTFVSKVEIDAATLFADADKHRPFRRIEERAGFEQIERGANRSRIERSPGCFVMAAPQPGPEHGAADRPGLTLAVDRNVGECGSGSGVK
jgi:hypothetical protein